MLQRFQKIISAVHFSSSGAILKTLFPNDKKVNRIDILNLLRNNFDLVTDEFCKQQFLQDNSKKIKRIAKSMLNPKEYQGEYIL